MKVEASRTDRPVTGRRPGDGALPPLPGWVWPLLWVALTVGIGLLVRMPGPGTPDPDEHAAVLYFDRLVAGERLEEPLLSSPKPLLTVVHGLAWRAGHDWRLLEALAVAAFALAVVCLARAAGRLAGLPAAAAVVVALTGSGALVLQAARANSMVFALAAWAVALEALTRGTGRAGGEGDGQEPAWAVAAGALLVAGLARPEGWLLLVPAAGYGLLAWWRGARRAALLLLPLAAPLLWFAHDWLLTGDPRYTLRVPGRYTDLIIGRQVIPPVDWMAMVVQRYAADPLLLALAGAGVYWLFRRRAWVWLAGLGVAGFGVLAVMGLEAWRGTYISWRYYDPADVALRVTAALGAAALATAAARRLLGAGAGAAADRASDGRARWAGAAPGVAAALVVAAACWPLAPVDPHVDNTLNRDTRLSANAATAIALLGPVTAEPGTVLTVSGLQRIRVAIELDLPLGRVRNLYLARKAAPMDRALAGSAAVFHDADGDIPTDQFTALRTTARTRLGTVELVPLHTDPDQGLYIHQVAEPGG